MPGDHPRRSPTAPVLMRLPAPGHFLLRPQLLTRVSALLGRALAMIPTTAPTIAIEHRRRTAERWDIRRTALPKGARQQVW
jgi:hypothetical protein